MTHICITDTNLTSAFDQFVEAADFVSAAELLAESRGWSIAPDAAINNQGVYPRLVARDLEPREFWMVAISAYLGDAYDWGHGSTREEASAMAHPGSVVE